MCDLRPTSFWLYFANYFWWSETKGTFTQSQYLHAPLTIFLRKGWRIVCGSIQRYHNIARVLLRYIALNTSHTNKHTLLHTVHIVHRLYHAYPLLRSRSDEAREKAAQAISPPPLPLTSFLISLFALFPWFCCVFYLFDCFAPTSYLFLFVLRHSSHSSRFLYFFVNS
jgi:hypothetical protein